MKIRKRKLQHTRSDLDSASIPLATAQTTITMLMMNGIKHALLQFSWVEHYIKFKPPTIRLIKYRARQQGFDIDCVKSKFHDTLVVFRIRFNSQKDYTAFLLRWS